MRGRKPNLGGLGLTLFTYACALAMIFPIVWTVLTSFKSEVDAVAQPPSLAFVPTLEHYREAFLDQHYLEFFRNSMILALGSTLLACVIGIPAAYGLSLQAAAKAQKTLSWILSTKMLPVVGIVVPLLVLYKSLGLFDTYVGMILLYAAMNLPLVIWMMRSFFAEVPHELIEASSIDGAGTLRTLVSIVLPLALPGIAATALLCVIFAWNEFFIAVNLTGSRTGTIPVYISGFMTSEGLFWAKMSAASTLAIIPVFCLGLAAQRSLVRGLTMGAIK